MQLIRLTKVDGGAAYVNPAHITVIYPSIHIGGREGSMICMANTAPLYVVEGCENIRAMIR